ncbi:MAG TPA: hypothetical protein VED86_05345 [archaeon]|nr:hypothetical protein [archaeon]
MISELAYFAISSKAAANPSKTRTNVTTAAVVRLKTAELTAEDVCVVFHAAVSAKACRVVAGEVRKKEWMSITTSIKNSDEILNFKIIGQSPTSVFRQQ